MAKRKEVTTTHLVLEALMRADDFRTQQQLCAEIGRDCNHVSAALYMLRGYCAVQVMEVDGKLFWFATPEDDTRSRRHVERAPELRPRKPRKTGPRRRLRVQDDQDDL